MTNAQREEIRKLLLALHDELSGKGLQKIEPNRTDDARIGGDEDEQPLNEMLQTIASRRNRNPEGMLARGDKALAKLREDPDSFGECEGGGNEIASGRLRAMPYAESGGTSRGGKDEPKGPATRRKLTDYR